MKVGITDARSDQHLHLYLFQVNLCLVISQAVLFHVDVNMFQIVLGDEETCNRGQIRSNFISMTDGLLPSNCHPSTRLSPLLDAVFISLGPFLEKSR